MVEFLVFLIAGKVYLLYCNDININVAVYKKHYKFHQKKPVTCTQFCCSYRIFIFLWCILDRFMPRYIDSDYQPVLPKKRFLDCLQGRADVMSEHIYKVYVFDFVYTTTDQAKVLNLIFY
jgi:hypothetical protein